MGTKTYQGTLYVTECPTCSTTHGIPEAMRRQMSDHGGDAYCPNGHRWWFSDASMETKLKRANARARHLEDQKDAADLSAAAYKGHATRIKNRVRAGVCPFCNRSFGNVREHMDTKHADE